MYPYHSGVPPLRSRCFDSHRSYNPRVPKMPGINPDPSRSKGRCTSSSRAGGPDGKERDDETGRYLERRHVIETLIERNTIFDRSGVIPPRTALRASGKLRSGIIETHSCGQIG